MRFEILFLAMSAVTAVDLAKEDFYEKTCGNWKMSVFSNEAGWTYTLTKDGGTVYEDDRGNVVKDWTGFKGYDTSKCKEAKEVEALEA